MIKQLLMILLGCLLSMNLDAKSNDFYFINQADKVKADKLFQNKNYKEAKELYLKLSGAGDKYAQYILSVMNLNGLAGKSDLPKAYAWAKVAKENKSKDLVDHYKKIRSMLPSKDKDAILEASSKIYEKYSNLGVAERYLRFMKKEFPKCTGSRAKVNISACEKVRVTCNISVVFGGNTIPDLISSFGDKCPEFIDKIRPENLKKMKNDIEKLEVYIQEQKQKGRVLITEEK